MNKVDMEWRLPMSTLGMYTCIYIHTHMFTCIHTLEKGGQHLRNRSFLLASTCMHIHLNQYIQKRTYMYTGTCIHAHTQQSSFRKIEGLDFLLAATLGTSGCVVYRWIWRSSCVWPMWRGRAYSGISCYFWLRRESDYVFDNGVMFNGELELIPWKLFIEVVSRLCFRHVALLLCGFKSVSVGLVGVVGLLSARSVVGSIPSTQHKNIITHVSLFFIANGILVSLTLWAYSCFHLLIERLTFENILARLVCMFLLLSLKI